MSDARHFIELLFPAYPEGFRAELRAIRPDAKPVQRFFASADELALVANRLSVTCDVYVGVAYRGPQNNGTKNNLRNCNALWADMDCGPDKPHNTFDDVWARLGDFALPASLVVESGGGLHAYWLLAEPWPLESAADIAEFEAALKGLAAALDADRAATDASRVLRVPGTLNHKWKPPRAVHLRELGLQRYSFTDFASIVPALGRDDAPASAEPFISVAGRRPIRRLPLA